MSVVRLLAILAALVVACAGSIALTAPATAQTADECSDGRDNDGDGRVDGADNGCRTEADPGYVVPPPPEKARTVAVPLVTLRGTVARSGAVKIQLLRVDAYRGSKIRITCRGKGCPVKKQTRVVLTSSLELRNFRKRTLKPGARLTLRIRRNGELGKYTRYTVRRRKAPKREDLCIEEGSSLTRPCFQN